MKTSNLFLIVLSALYLTVLTNHAELTFDTRPDGYTRKTSKSERALEPTDFKTRCKTAGVLVCKGFDSSDDFITARWPGSGLYPAADGYLHGFFDTDVKASGKGSLRFEIPPHSGPNASGYWRQSIGRAFGEGTTFYVQFRQRFSREMLKNDWGDTTWKQAIFHNASATCGELGLTTVQYYHAGFPIMYTACGARMLATNDGRPPYLLQQGDYNCWYGQYNAKSCFFYPMDQWVTFYYRVSIGHWGKQDSQIEAWIALDGQPYKQWIKMMNYLLRNEDTGSGYDTVTLLTYMTNKNPAAAQPLSSTWYDELIVSTEPIAPPTISAANTHAQNPK